MNIKKHINKYKFFEKASRTADENGCGLFIVGGYVRDQFLGRKRNEIDFLVLGNGPDFARKYASSLKVKNVTIFKNFGTAHFKYRGIDFEFVGARKESYRKESRKPDIETGTFIEDIKRRDFTINTMAVSLNKETYGELIDTFSGLEDLNNGLIKTPLDPLITFNDDPLRIMRAFRFASQLKFNVDDAAFKAAVEMAPRLQIVSQERKSDEFLKILASPQPSIGLKLMQNSGVMEEIFPEISALAGVDQRKDYHHKDVFLHTCIVVDNVAEVSDDVWLRFAALVHDIAKPATKKFIEGIGWTFHGHEEIGARMMKKIFSRMKLPFTKLDYVRKLIRLHLRPSALADSEVTDSAIRRLVVEAGDDLDDLITLCRADITSKNPAKVSKYLANYDRVMLRIKEVREKDKLRAFQSPVRGDEIMKICNLPPSKKVGEIKSAIEEAILEGEIKNDYVEALAYLMKIKEDFLKE